MLKNQNDAILRLFIFDFLVENNKLFGLDKIEAKEEIAKIPSSKLQEVVIQLLINYYKKN